MITRTNIDVVLIRPDTHGFIEVPTKAYDDAIRCLQLKAVLGERTSSDVLLCYILKDCGAFEEDDELVTYTESFL